MTVRFIQGHYFFWHLSVGTFRRLVYCNYVTYSSEHALARRSSCGKSQTVVVRKIKATFVTYIAPYRTNPMSRSSRQHSYFVFDRIRTHISASKQDTRGEFSWFFPSLYANSGTVPQNKPRPLPYRFLSLGVFCANNRGWRLISTNQCQAESQKLNVTQAGWNPTFATMADH